MLGKTLASVPVESVVLNQNALQPRVEEASIAWKPRLRLVQRCPQLGHEHSHIPRRH